MPETEAHKRGIALTAETAQLAEDLSTFLAKWQLARLVTWELPEPQGPIIGPPSVLPSLTPNQVVTSIPTFFDIGSSSTFRDLVVENQRALARSLGIHAEHPVRGIAPSQQSGATTHGGGASMPAASLRLFSGFGSSVRQLVRGTESDGVSRERLKAGFINWVAGLGQEIRAKRCEQLYAQLRSTLSASNFAYQQF